MFISLIILPIIVIITIAYFTYLIKNKKDDLEEGFAEMISISTSIGTPKNNEQAANDTCNYADNIYTQDNFDLRECQVYFTEDKQACDTEKQINPDSTCKYKFNGWQEFKNTTKDNVKLDYAQKVYTPSKMVPLNNHQLVAKCFKEISGDATTAKEYEYIANNIVKKDCPGGANNYHTFNGKNYVSMKFMNGYDGNDGNNAKTLYEGVLNTICSVNYEPSSLISSLKDTDLYMLELDSNNKIKSELKKGKFDASQKNFVLNTNFDPSSFASSGSVGLAFDKEKKLFVAFNTSKADLSRTINIYKMRYNYLCGTDSPVIELQTFNAKIDLSKLYTFTQTTTEYIQKNDKTNDMYIMDESFFNKDDFEYKSNNPIDVRDKIIVALDTAKGNRINAIVNEYKTHDDVKSIYEIISNIKNKIKETDAEKSTFESGLTFATVNEKLGITSGNYVLHLAEYDYSEAGNDFNNANIIKTSNELKYEVLDGYLYYRFTSTSEYSLTFNVDVKDCEIFMIGGGGGGGYNHGGGGGAGAYYNADKINFDMKSTYIFKVGAGGEGESFNGATAAQNGGDTYIQKNGADVYRCKGGGAGGSLKAPYGANGGCGGGGVGYDGTQTNKGTYAGGITTNGGTVGTGYAGGVGTHNYPAGHLAGGGGGGIGGAGANAQGIEAGNGGDGIVVNITTLNEEVFGGGGGGGEATSANAPAGLGGGAILSNGTMMRVGGNAGRINGDWGNTAIPNTGSGGGSGKESRGGNGSAGIILLKIKVNAENEKLSTQQILRNVLATEDNHNYVKHPRTALSSAEVSFNGKKIRVKQNGNFCCYGDAWRLFTHNTYHRGHWYHGGTPVGNRVEASYTAPNGTVRDTASISFDSNYRGDWVMIDLGEQINLKKIKFWPRTNFVSRCPALFRIYATNSDQMFNTSTFTIDANKDGDKGWVLIHDTGSQELQYDIYQGQADAGTAIINNNSNNIKYKIFCLVVNKLVGNSGHAYVINFNEWELYADESQQTSQDTSITITQLNTNLQRDLQRFNTIHETAPYKDSLECSSTSGYSAKKTADIVSISSDKFYKYKLISSVFLEKGHYKFRCYLYHATVDVINSSIMTIETAPGSGAFVSACCFFTKIAANSKLGNIQYKYNMWTTKDYIYYDKSGFYNICFTCFGYNSHTDIIRPSFKFYYDYKEPTPSIANRITNMLDIDVKVENNLSRYELNANFPISDFSNPTWITTSTETSTSSATEPVLTRFPREPSPTYEYTYANGTKIRIKSRSYAGCHSCQAWALFNYPATYDNNSHIWAKSYATAATYTDKDPTDSSIHRKTTSPDFFKTDKKFNGEWVMIDMGEKIVPRKYRIYPMNDPPHGEAVCKARAPREFRIYATSDDNAWNNLQSLSWVMLDERLNTSYQNLNQKEFDINNISKRQYRYFAILIHKNGDEGQPWVQFSKWEIYGYVPQLKQEITTSSSSPVALYDYYLKTAADKQNVPRINKIYETIYPRRNTDSSYTEFTSYYYQNNDAYNTASDYQEIEIQKGLLNNIAKHYAIKIGEYKLKSDESFSYKDIKSEYDSTLLAIDKSKLAFQNYVPTVNGKAPEYNGMNMSIFTGLLSTTANAVINDEKIITHEKFPQSDLSSAPHGRLPQSSGRSIYFKFT